MIGTESKLWKRMTMADLVAPLPSLRRIESAITPGASDVVYTGRVNAGWIELKTSAWPRARRPFTLHSPFTIEQSRWLLSHDNPTHHLRSWILLGVIGPRTWQRFILFNPQDSIALLQGRKGVAHEILLRRHAVREFFSMEEVLRSLDR